MLRSGTKILLAAMAGLLLAAVFVFVGVPTDQPSTTVGALSDIAGVETPARTEGDMREGKTTTRVVSSSTVVAWRALTSRTETPWRSLNARLEGPVPALGQRSEWLAEWKWDGIRAQLIHRLAEHEMKAARTKIL